MESSEAVLQYELQNATEEVLNESLSKIEDLCRICATSNQYMTTIFEGEGLENGLGEKINSLLPITVSKEDEFTHFICYQCASHIMSWYDLRKCAINADIKFRNSLKLCNEQSESCQEASLNNSVIQIEPTETNINEESEYPNAEERSEVLQHKKPSEIIINCTESQSPKTKYLRKNSPLKRKSKDYVGNRTIENNSPIEYSQNEDLINIQEGMISIDENSYKLSCSSLIKINDQDECGSSSLLSRDDNTINELKVCPGDIKKEDDNFEDESDHTKDANFLCSHCSKVYTKKSDLLDHLFNDHIENPSTRIHNKLDRKAIEKAKMCVDGRVYYHCSECGKNLHSPYTFSWHARIHTGERPFICDLCGKQFRVSQGLVRHLKETHAGIKKFSCDICDRRFATKRNVAEHRRIHTGERPYVCDLCGKSFKQKASLFVHNRSHTDIYPFNCSFCTQSFRTKPTLLIHETKHTGVKPYPCSECGRCFRIKYELKRHMLIHSSEKPFSCKICNISFRQKRYLRNHNKNNHIIIPEEDS